MAMLFCYFDESGKKSDHPVVTVAAVCATQNRLQQFDDAWNVLLRQYELPALHMARGMKLSRRYGPKMPANQTAGERTDALIPFAECINLHLEYGLIQALDINGYNGLASHLRQAMNSEPRDPFNLAFARAMMELNQYTHQDDRISLVCDDDAETAWDCYSHYRTVCRVHDEMRRKCVALTFANDQYFPALQASDMVAALARLEAKRRFYKDSYSFRRLFRTLATERPNNMKWGAVFADQEKLLDLGRKMAATEKSKK